jgi:hypothetical protein
MFHARAFDLKACSIGGSVNRAPVPSRRGPPTQNLSPEPILHPSFWLPSFRLPTQAKPKASHLQHQLLNTLPDVTLGDAHAARRANRPERGVQPGFGREQEPLALGARELEVELDGAIVIVRAVFFVSFERSGGNPHDWALLAGNVGTKKCA